MGVSECEPQPEPQPEGFCPGQEGAVQSVVRRVEGMWNTIIGGQPAENRYSTVYVVAVNQGACTGTVLTPHTVLTAGHCIGDGAHRIYLEPGTGVPYFTASATLIHPGYYRWSTYRGEPHDDLALVYVDGQTLPPPYVEGLYQSGNPNCESLLSQGWGQTDRSDAPPPEDYERLPCPEGKTKCLQESSIYVLREKATDLDTQIPHWGGICFGDSGGPIYAKMSDGRMLVAGVTSTTTAANCVGYNSTRAYSTHVNLTAYRDWIDANVR